MSSKKTYDFIKHCQSHIKCTCSFTKGHFQFILNFNSYVLIELKDSQQATGSSWEKTHEKDTCSTILNFTMGF